MRGSTACIAGSIMGGDEGAHAIELGLRVVGGDVAPFHLEIGTFGDDVEDRAALHGADMEVVCGGSKPSSNGPSCGEAARFGGDVGDGFAGRVDRVDALGRFAGMAGPAAHVDQAVQLALVGDDRLHAGWLADDAERGFQAGLADIFDQADGAEAADFLVVGDEQMHRTREAARQRSGTAARQAGDEAFHVAGCRGRIDLSSVARSVNGSLVQDWPSTGTVSTWPDSAMPPGSVVR